MKKYIIIKEGDRFAVVSKEDLKTFYKVHFLPLILSMKHKKDLIFLIENNAHYAHLKGQTEYKTTSLY